MSRESIKRTSSSTFDRKKRKQKRFFLWFVLAVVLFLSVGFLSRVNAFKVSVVDVEVDFIVSADSVKDSVDEFLNSRFLFTRENFLFFKTKKLEEYLEKNFIEFYEVDVSRKALFDISIKIQEHDIYAYWCEESCYGVNEEFELFVTAGELNSAYPIIYSEDSGQKKGSILGNIESFKKAVDAYNILRDFDIESWAVEQLNGGQYRILFAKRFDKESPYIAFHGDQNLGEFKSTIKAMVADSKTSEILFEKYDNLEYIDTRFKNRIIYKYKDENINQENSINLSEEENLDEDN